MIPKINARRWWGGHPPEPGLRQIAHEDEQSIEELLVGKCVVEVEGDHLMLDDGTVVKVIPNEGGCSCGAGDYDLDSLARVDNVITKVVLDYHPDGDDMHTYDFETGKYISKVTCEHGNTTQQDDGYPIGHYRIFVLAQDEKIMLANMTGSDGNGYYGTGFDLVVRPPTVPGEVVSEEDPAVRQAIAAGGLAEEVPSPSGDPIICKHGFRYPTRFPCPWCKTEPVLPESLNG